jgi:hypothetical protein
LKLFDLHHDNGHAVHGAQKLGRRHAAGGVTGISGGAVGGTPIGS